MTHLSLSTLCSSFEQVGIKSKYKKIFLVSGQHPHRRMNSVVLMCAYQIFLMKRTAEEAYAPFKDLRPKLPYFHDPSPWYVVAVVFFPPAAAD